MKVIQRYISGSFMIIVSLTFLIAAYLMKNQDITNPAGSSFFPAVITLILLVCGVINLFEGRKIPSFSFEGKKGINELQTIKIEEKSTETAEEPDEEAWTKKDFLLVLPFLLLVILLVFAISYIPFYIVAFLFLVLSIMYFKGVSWKKNLLISVSTIIVLYVLFNLIFKIVFP